MDGTFNSHINRGYRGVLLYVDDIALHIAAQQNWPSIGSDGGNSIHPFMHLHAALREYALDYRSRPGEARHEPLQRRFEVMARTTPCAIAVSFNGRCLSYGDLDEQADALALHLQAAGLAPCSFCMVDLAPSLAQVRAMLAVLKAGAACLQVDARVTPNAVAAVLEALAPAFCVTRGAVQAGAPAAALHTVRCDEDAADLPYGWPDELPVGPRTPAWAYATLTPQGDLCIVVRTHRALNELIDRAPAAAPEAGSGPDPGGLWRPLSRGAPLTIGAPAPAPARSW